MTKTASIEIYVYVEQGSFTRPILGDDFALS
jgi:hypothetical protein